MAVAAAALLAACGDNIAPGASGDAGQVRDGSPPDGSPRDGSPADARADAGPGDAGAADAPPDGPPPDAPPGVGPCLGQPVPPAEGPSVTINGAAMRISAAGQQPVAGVAMQAFLVGTTTNPLDTAVTAANGTYSLSAPTVDGQAVNAYLRATHADFFDTYLYPAMPVFQAMLDGATAVLLNQGAVDLAVLITGAAQPPGRGLIVLIVTDCDGLPIAGATVSSSPPAGAVHYFRNNAPSPTATDTGADGFAVLFNVPPGPVEVDAEISGTSLREHTLDVIPDAIMSTIIAP